MVADRIYAIGDVHGRADLLRALLAHIGREAPDGMVIFLGDLIDRGPDSCGVLDLVAAHLRANPASRLLLGNHDWFLRELLQGSLDASGLELWADRYGAAGALRSYGISDPASDWQAARRVVLERHPSHLQLLAGAEYCVVKGDLCFVHAGLRPGVPLSQQSPADMMWIKDAFLDHREPFGHLVVHGHSPTPSGLPEVHSNRIALDTHAFRSGHLSAAAFDGGALSHFLRTTVSPDGAVGIEHLC